MIDLNKFDGLLLKYCPNGVSYRRIEDICEILDRLRKPITKGDRVSGEYPYFGANGIQDYVSDYIFDGTFVLIGEDGSVINPDKSPVLTWASGKIWVNNHAHVLTTKNATTLRYVFYSLQTLDISSLVRGVPPKLNQESLRDLSIPFPPLEIQEEIVRILDSFTALTAELTAELTARKKQYEFYRDKLLSFDDLTPEERERLGVRWMTIKDLSTSICSGGTPLKSRPNDYNGNIPWLRTQEVTFNEIHSTECSISEEGLKNSSAKWIPENCVIVAISGATAARCAINKIPLTTNQHCCNIQVNPKIALYRYVFHWFSSQYLNLKSKGRGAREDITTQIIANYPICVPSINEQERIVEILDSFDSLCSNLSDGIPAEINARQKQYEYYRDKILSFAEDKT